MRKRTILILSFVPVYAVFFGELFLRIFDPVPILPRYVKAMAYGIRGNSENMSYWHRTAEYDIEIRTNSRGIRADSEISYKKPEGVKRIVLLGDSFGMGYGVDLDDSFAAQIVEHLEVELNQPVELVNLSTSGHGNAEELIVLREVGFRYDPDLVLLSWHASDLEDNVRSGLFKLKAEELEEAASEYLPAMKTREFLLSFAAYRFLVEHSHAYTFVREEFARFVKAAMLVLKSNSELSRETAEALPSAEALSIALLERVNKECELREISFLLVEVPLRSSRKKFVSAFPTDFMELSYPAFSPLSLFDEYAGSEKLYWERSHGHYTPLGCEIVGAGIAEAILREGLLK